MIIKTFNLPILSILLILVFGSSCKKASGKVPFLLGAGYGVDGITLVVDDLKSATAYYRGTLGFTIFDNTGKGIFKGSINTSTTFSDKSVLEILSLNDTLPEEFRSSFLSTFLAHNEGVRLYTLSSSSADSTSIWLTSQRFQVDPIYSYRIEEVEKGWSWDDGSPQRHSLFFNSADPPPYLPNFLERADLDYKFSRQEWKTFYNYNRMFRLNPNGVVGISAIRVAVEDLEANTEEFQKMGFKMLDHNDSLTRFHLDRNQELHLVTPRSTNDEISDFLQSRGPGVFAIRFEVSNLDSTSVYLKERLPERALKIGENLITVSNEFALGVQLEFIEEPEAQRLMAKQLSQDDVLDSTAAQHAAEIYAKYCVLCHGENREGYAADHAPSLRSHSLLATSKNNNFMRYTIQYGRAGTAMGGYISRQGGPLDFIEIELLLQWLYEMAEVDVANDLSREPVSGDVALGEEIYDNKCARCHGENGEGITAPALGNSMLLATATDHFLRYAISEGRDGTPMKAFKDSLNNTEIDAVTAFLRTRASGWEVPARADTTPVPSPENYVLNPTSKAPNFMLKDGKYLPAKQLIKALQDSLRLVILDARSEVAWRQMHIPGSIPVPYYEEPENFVSEIPNDSTWVIAYCACPHKASEKVVNTLKRYGYKNTAILDEGILVWSQLGYPVEYRN
ncbi:MAG: c-type cytochrome [Bacteroidota bacterium]